MMLAPQLLSLGQTSITAKVFETKDALQNSADKISYSNQYTALRNSNTVI